MALCFVVVFVFVGGELILVELHPAEWTQTWAVWSWQIPETQIRVALGAAGIVALVSTASLVIASRVFRRVNSSELYFVLLFLLAISFESLRVLQVYFRSIDLPAVYGVLLTRLVLAARVAGAISLFAASLYGVGIEYPRIGSVTIAVSVASIVFVSVVPIDSITMQASLLHRANGQSSLDIVLFAIGALTILNYVIAGARIHRDRSVFAAVVGFCLVVGSQLLWFVPAVVTSVAAVALLLVGTAVFLLVTRARHLWY